MAAPRLISVKVQDGEGKERTVPFYCNSAEVTTVANATTVINAIIPLLFGDDNPSQCGVVSAEVTFSLDLTAAETVKPSAFTPVAGSRFDSGATLSFRNENNRAYPLYIPAIRSVFIAGEKVVVNPGDEMDDFIQTMIAGVTGMDMTDENNLDITGFREGNQSVRKN